jgi:hypothetical protein
MTDESITVPVPARRVHLDWVPAVFITPRQTFKQIAAQASSVWLTPLVLLSLTALTLVIVSGPARQAAAQSSLVLPQDFQNYSPEMQAQTMQAAQATQGPVFIYGFPALLALGKVWAGWLLVGGLLHLGMTLFGGRGSTGSAMNLVAWSALPFGLRDIVRIIATASTHQLINTPGISGFAPQGGRAALFLSKLMASLDVYLIWHILLLVLGVCLATGLTRRKSWSVVFLTILVGVCLEAAFGFLASLLGSMSVTRPFFF